MIEDFSVGHFQVEVVDESFQVGGVEWTQYEVLVYRKNNLIMKVMHYDLDHMIEVFRKALEIVAEEKEAKSMEAMFEA